VAELLNGVNASSLQQLSELGAYALDAEQISVICPFQDKLSGNV
jgi:hypothetical protein